MKRLKTMKECLIGCVMNQMGDLKNTDTKELGEAIDMIKDLEEAIYYCTITKAMEGGNGEKKWDKQHEEPHEEHRMYYPEDKEWRRQMPMKEKYREQEYPMVDMRDPREGRSYMSRRMYMESKEMGRDKLSNIQDLEHYMSELSEDIVEMIENSSPEEKQLLQKKLNMLAQKVVSG